MTTGASVMMNYGVIGKKLIKEKINYKIEINYLFDTICNLI